MSEVPKSQRSGKKESNWDLPAEVLGVIGVLVLPLFVFLAVFLLFGPLTRARSGDPGLFWVAVGLGAIGVLFLFFARRQLYRERRFWSVGPGGLDAWHRRLYWLAYAMIGGSVALLFLLRAVVK